MLKASGKAMKQLFAVSILALAVMAWAACEEPAPTPVPSPTPEPAAAPAATPALASTPLLTPTVAPAPTQAPGTPSAPAPTPTPTPSPAPTAQPEPAAAGEQIDWAPCGAFECGSIQVPADYRDPEAGSINIAVVVHRATSPEKRIGYLLVNPGGPGASGVAFALSAKRGGFSDEVVERFDIVGFDPRGVGLSDELVASARDKLGIDFSELVGGGSGPEFACGEPGEQRALLKSIEGYIDTPEEIAAGEAAANLCIETMGPVGGLLHSAYAANDMDELRKALGAEQVSYYGVSYGSRLGLWYATLFPDSVRAMVVDGATNFKVDQTLGQEELVAAEIEGDIAPYAIQLEQALAACADPECPIYNDGDPVGYFRQTAAKMDGTSRNGVQLSLNNQHNWPMLWQGLFDLNENDDSSILDEIVERYQKAVGGGSGSVGSITRHINCLDQWVLRPELDRAARLAQPQILDATVAETLPLWALVRSSSSARPCPFYDQFAPEPFAGPLDGGGVPILVVGNRSDPATPFSESVKFATETVRNGYLVGADHFKHGVYPGNRCVTNHVHRALIDGVYPSARQVFCEREDEAAETPGPEPAAAGERIDWTRCVAFECGSIQVPADYRDPEAGSINIAVLVRRATSPEKRIGYLLVNPGGPGASGVLMAASRGNSLFTDEILERFDIVGFDPRGVGLDDQIVAGLGKAGLDAHVLFRGGSEPAFACGDFGEQLALRASIDGAIDTPEEIAIGEAAANLCIESMGPVGGLLHSEYVVRDMDEIRQALGAEQISYLGFSYGAELGVWYATLFPDSVRAMAVDGARNPFPFDPSQEEREPEPQAPELQAPKPKRVTGLAAYEAKLAEALAACADPQCPIYNDGDPVGYYRQAAAKLHLVVAASNHPEGGYFGVLSASLAETSWPDLWQGLYELNENDDPAILVEYARQRSYVRQLGASFNEHVNCLDEWVLKPEQDRATRLEKEARRYAYKEESGAYGEKYPLLGLTPRPSLLAVCTFYDQFAPEPLAGPFGGDLPILVIGNHADPRTPFGESEEVATEVLSNGYLVETSHYKHVVFPQNECVNSHVHRALIDGEFPSARRVVCEEDRTFAPGPETEPEPAAATGEQIAWNPCGPLECGSIQAPADYRDPDAGSIRIAVAVHRATSPEKRIGYLLVNPGGPGKSGVLLAFAAPNQFTDEVIERFDIVGFDPRGVGLSAELVAGFERLGIDTGVLGGGSGPDFACGGPGEQLALLASIDGAIDTPEEIAAGEAAANLCIQSMGPVGGLLHSAYVAYDMDEIPQALGSEQISYFGASYGSALGVWYATLFPDSVRAMVVDGASNPVEQATTRQERVASEIQGEWAPFETLLEKALTACAADPQCPIYNDGNPVGYFKQAAAKLGLVNAAAGNNPEAGTWGVGSTVYSEKGWPDLWQGLFELNENDDPSILLKYAEKQFPDQGPTAASFSDHVNCLDNWSLQPELGRSARLDDAAGVAAAFKERIPLMAVLRSYSWLADACPFYDRFAPAPLEGPLDGGGVPILVIGNHSDPATPFSKSEEIATEVLSNGYLVETSHYKHVVYPQNECVNNHVYRALFDGVYPSDRRVFCEEDRTFAP